MPLFPLIRRAVFAVFVPWAAAQAGDSAPVKLIDLQHGDRACYVVVQMGKTQRSIEGDFELCPGGSRDASPLIGGMVVYATRRDKVQAMSCGGNPACTKTDSVDLVTRLTRAD